MLKLKTIFLLLILLYSVQLFAAQEEQKAMHEITTQLRKELKNNYERLEKAQKSSQFWTSFYEGSITAGQLTLATAIFLALYHGHKAILIIDKKIQLLHKKINESNLTEEEKKRACARISKGQVYPPFVITPEEQEKIQQEVSIFKILTVMLGPIKHRINAATPILACLLAGNGIINRSPIKIGIATAILGIYYQINKTSLQNTNILFEFIDRLEKSNLSLEEQRTALDTFMQEKDKFAKLTPVEQEAVLKKTTIINVFNPLAKVETLLLLSASYLGYKGTTNFYTAINDMVL